MAGTRSGVRAGTRGGVGRIAAMAIALAVMLGLVLVDAARAGTYRVAQCGWGVGVELDPAAATSGEGFSLRTAGCGSPAGEPQGLTLEAAAEPGEYVGSARARWVAPPGVTIVAARATWGGVMQQGFRQGLAIEAGTESHLLATASGATPLGPVAVELPGGGSALEVRIACREAPFADRCTRSQPSWLLLGGVTLTLDDPTPPRAQLAGPLLASGWRRGTAALEISAEDAGSGIARDEATADGVALGGGSQPCATLSVEGELRATRMRPCPPLVSRTVEVDTAGLTDGSHVVRDCVVDFAGGIGCAPGATIAVDNSAPALAFAATEEGQVAVTVADPYSGPSSGSISMRRADADGWTDLPTAFSAAGAGRATLAATLPALGDGAYVFRATAADAVGNAGSVQLRASGSAAEVRRRIAAGQEGSGAVPGPARGGGKGPRGRGGPGKTGSVGGRATHLVARLVAPGGNVGGPRPDRRSGDGPRADRASRDGRHAGSTVTLAFGTAATVRGRLTGDDGAAVADRQVRVIAEPAPGASARRSVRRAVTDGRGRFELRLAPGPSRRVVVTFPGGGGLAPSRSTPLALRVRGAVSLTASPPQLQTGQAVSLAGRVLPGDARIPNRGKVVAIQYLERASGDWRPALVTRTDGRGRFEVRYRFRYITGAARIRLRATALPEAGWPYAAGSSPPVTVEVHGG
jgi:hypothetical protein